MTLKMVGLLCGREASFPPAFLEEVNRRGGVVGAEYVQLGGTRMDEPCPYAVLIDRISHEVPYYRSYLKNAVLQGVTGHQQPVHVDGRRQVLRGDAGHQARRRPSARRSCCPTRTTCPASCRRRACATSSTRWTGTPSSSTSACRACSRTPTAAAGRTCRSVDPFDELIHHYNQSGLLTMVRAGVHPVGAVRPLPVPGPGGRAADEVRPRPTPLSASNTTTSTPTLGAADRDGFAEAGAGAWATT